MPCLDMETEPAAPVRFVRVRARAQPHRQWHAEGAPAAGLPESHPAGMAGIGSAVTDLIFSIAKREVTFFSDTAPISFL